MGIHGVHLVVLVEEHGRFRAVKFKHISAVQLRHIPAQLLRTEIVLPRSLYISEALRFDVSKIC